ncbi:hypothetical protein DFH06DRAFT_1161056 [Mycena polygramma]|nr:hypothetical protein DFH06DRAFT_1161056 [Mycena polygramma]
MNSSASSQAPPSVRFIVVGGSLAGLASAYVLREAGHAVVVLEKRDGRTKTGGSVRSPPNMTRILGQWPGIDSLRKRATKCTGFCFRRGDTAERVGFMKFHDEIMSELEADFLVFQYDDLARHLTHLCLNAGVVIKYGREAVGISTADGTVSVSLSDGSVVNGDIVIGADGHNSMVRDAIVEDEEDELEVMHTITGINMSVPTKAAEEIEDFKSLCTYNELSIWMGNGSTVIGSLDHRAEKFNLSLYSADAAEVDYAEWAASCRDKKKKTMPFDLSEYEPRLQKLMRLADSCYPTVQQVLEQEDSVGFDRTAVLVGDAAHAVAIHGANNAAMGIEDAETLGRLFSRISSKSQTGMLLNAYQEIRHRRTSSCVEAEYEALAVLSLPTEHQAARDAALRPSLTMEYEDFDDIPGDGMIWQLWEGYLMVFSYNAAEEVDSWWSMWGAMVDDGADSEEEDEGEFN